LEYTNDPQVISLSDIFISPLEDMYVCATPLPEAFPHRNYSYFVTELLGTDLHRLLTSRPLEKQFIQYFLYQILVSISDLQEYLAVLILL
jgi:p38 MAP kinase